MHSSFKLSLIGHPRIVGACGNTLPLKSGKSMALLAMLVLAEGRPLSRAWLQDKLWSRSEPGHGRDSLKKAIAKLRGTFGEHGADVIVTDGGPVSINPDLICADYAGQALDGVGTLGETLLQGLDEIRDDEFRDWLRHMRQEICGRLVAKDTLSTRQELAIEKVRHLAGDEKGVIVGDLILNRIVKLMRLDDNFDVVDLRDRQAEPTHGASLSARVLIQGPKIVLDLILRRVSDQRILLGREIVIDEMDILGDDMRSWLVNVTGQISRGLQRYLAPEDRPAIMASHQMMRGIDMLMRNDDGQLDKIEKAFLNAIEMSPRGVYYAWLAYLGAFSFEERKGLNSRDLRDRTDMIAEGVLEHDPDNALARALLAHCYGFVCKDLDRAAELVRPIRDEPSDNPLVHHCLGLFDFYSGNLDRARRSAMTSRLIGGNHSFSFGFDTTCMMIDFSKGDFASAIKFGESALRRQSLCLTKFEPSLRYLAAAQALNGDLSQARESWELLCRQSSADRQLEAVASGLVAPQQTSKEFLSKGFRLILSE